MTPWNIIVKMGSADTFATTDRSTSERYVDFPLHNKRSWVSAEEIYNFFGKHDLVLTPTLEDLLNLTLAVYTTDQVVSRSIFGFQGWSRHLKVYMPVREFAKWSLVKDTLEKLLSFLSGDKWELHFREHLSSTVVVPLIAHNLPITKVALFSGGLDSFISAIDLLEAGEHPLFVSHYKKGSSESSAQVKLQDALRTQYGDNRFTSFKCYVQPNHKDLNITRESSSRARSFLFLCLGIVFANAIGPDIPLIVPENGLIALNIPLTHSRLSSHSTRTTHPYYFKLFREMLHGLGIRNPIGNPYQFKTKGEMMSECANPTFLNVHHANTLSCSHPEQSRWQRGSRSGMNCGYCLPCIIRQGAEKKAGIASTDYHHQIRTAPPPPQKKSGRDLRAIMLALKNLEGLSRQSKIFGLLRPGPLPFADLEELESYLRVYEQGMEEVKQFIS